MREWSRWWPWLFAPLLLGVFILQYTLPIQDGDVWMHMAYGRYMLENRTLIPDHAAFSWSSVDNTQIYCAWTSQLVLYLLHSVAGLGGLFALRYACMAFVCFAVMAFARILGGHRHPFAWFCCLLGVLMAVEEGMIKPQIFSSVLMTMAVFVWLMVKAFPARAWKLVYCYPILMLVWVNTHGGVLFGGAFLFLMGIGEELNILFRTKTALPKPVMGHLRVALWVSVLAVFLTPYGADYPTSLLSYLLEENSESLGVVASYVPIYSENLETFNYVQHLSVCFLALFFLILLGIRKHGIDLAMILTNMVLALLMIRFVRLIPFWVPVFTFCAVYLISTGPLIHWSSNTQKVFGVIILSLCLGLGARAVSNTLASGLVVAKWFGLGVSYVHPVEEAAYIEANIPLEKIGNDYNNGSYLMWTLYGRTKTFIDGRHFPFLPWYDRYLDFHEGRNVEAFLAQNKADVWCLSLNQRSLIHWFLISGEWRPVFWGASSVVFANSSLPETIDSQVPGRGIGNMKNMYHGLQAFLFAVDVKDWDSAREILAGLEKGFQYENQRFILDKLRLHLEGMEAYEAGDFARAASSLTVVWNEGGQWGKKALVHSLLAESLDAWSAGHAKKSLRMAQTAWKVDPMDPVANFNLGIIISNLNQGLPMSIGQKGYKAYFTYFLESTPKTEGAFYEARETAMEIVNGKTRGSYPLLDPMVMNR